jgi:hypothetical protein
MVSEDMLSLLLNARVILSLVLARSHVVCAVRVSHLRLLKLKVFVTVWFGHRVSVFESYFVVYVINDFHG